MKRNLFTAALVALALSTLLPVCAQEGEPASRQLRILWSRPVKTPAALAVSPNGGFTAALAADGSLTYYDANGAPLWRKDMGGARAVALSGDGRILLTYSPLNPLRREIRIVRADGSVAWRRNTYGAVWCAAVSTDGSQAIVGTGRGKVYIFSIRKRGVRYRVRSLPGLPVSLAFTPDGKGFVAGMWQDSGLGMFDLQGKQVWRAEGRLDLLYTGDVSADGSCVLGRAAPNRVLPEAVFGLWNSAGVRLWQKRVEVDDFRAAVSQRGDAVAVSYLRRIVHKGRTMSERRLALYNRSGAVVWEKGGMFFKPELIALLPGNYILVSSEMVTLYLIDPLGKIGKLRMPASIKLCAPAGGRTAVYCSDGKLYMVGATPNP